jgi:hypothetical protein
MGSEVLVLDSPWNLSFISGLISLQDVEWGCRTDDKQRLVLRERLRAAAKLLQVQVTNPPGLLMLRAYIFAHIDPHTPHLYSNEDPGTQKQFWKSARNAVSEKGSECAFWSFIQRGCDVADDKVFRHRLEHLRIVISSMHIILHTPVVLCVSYLRGSSNDSIVHDQSSPVLLDFCASNDTCSSILSLINQPCTSITLAAIMAVH